MNKFLLLGLLAITTVIRSAQAQAPSAGVFLYIPTTTANTAIVGHTNEVKLQSFEYGQGVSVSSPSSGPTITVSQPSVSDFVMTKNFDITSLRLQYTLLSRTIIGQSSSGPVEIRYYNGTNSTAVYVISLDKAVISGFSSSNSQCPAGCPDNVESISITPVGTITFRNQSVTPNQVLTYNLSTGVANISNP